VHDADSGEVMLIPKKYQTVAIASILVVASLIILSISIHRPGETGFFKKLVLEAASPLIGVVNSTVYTVRDVWKRYIFLVGLEQENRMLKARVAQLTNELNEYRERHLEGIRLRKLFALKETLPGTVVAARVIDRENAYVFKTILVDKGTSDGLRVGLPVISAEGVVGRIVDSSWNVSRVLLITDYNSNTSAFVQGSRVQGILQGGGGTNCSLKYVERSEEVRTGETVVTSGLGGVFPKGLILGTVSGVDRRGSGLFLNIDVLPAVHFSRLEEVLAVTPDKERKP
jgi:rod shape-determining protein MreC